MSTDAIPTPEQLADPACRPLAPAKLVGIGWVIVYRHLQHLGVTTINISASLTLNK